MNLSPVSYRNIFVKNNIQFKNQTVKNQIAKEYAKKIIEADVAYETISEINRLMLQKEEFNSKISTAKTLYKQIIQPLNEGVDLKLLEYHKIIKNLAANRDNYAPNKTNFVFKNNNIEYYYKKGSAEYPDIITMQTKDKEGKDLHAYVYYDCKEKKFDYRLRDFIITKNFNYLDAIIQDDNIKNLSTHENFQSTIGFAYKFNENNKVQKAKTILYSQKAPSCDRKAAFSFDENGEIKNLIIAPQNNNENSFFSKEVDLEKFVKIGKEFKYIGTTKGTANEIEKFLNF